MFDIYQIIFLKTNMEQLKSQLATGKVVCRDWCSGEFQFRPMDIPSDLRQR